MSASSAPGTISGYLHEINTLRRIVSEVPAGAESAPVRSDVADRFCEAVALLGLAAQRGLADWALLRRPRSVQGLIERVSAWQDEADRRLLGGRRHFRRNVVTERINPEVAGGIGRLIERTAQLAESVSLGAEVLAEVHAGRWANGARPLRRTAAAPSARHEGGAYYTPPLLVEHILEHVVPPGFAGRIVDPACGPATFLLAALNRSDAVRSRAAAAARLAYLRDGVFGVDADCATVEIARLVLLLRAVEGLGAADVNGLAQALVPVLADNIRHGDALVDPIEAGDADADVAIAPPVNWPAAFPEACGPGRAGFDVVVGNPPWGQKRIRLSARRRDYLRAQYPSSVGIFDLFRPFVELAGRCCRAGGKAGLVLPDILLLKNYECTRRYVLDHFALERIDWWGMRFADAVIDAVTLIGTRGSSGRGHRLIAGLHSGSHREHPIRQATFRRTPRCTFNLHLTSAKVRLLRRLERLPRLGSYFEVHEGVHSGNIRAALFVPGWQDESCRPLVLGGDELRPHSLRWAGRYVRLAAVPSCNTRKRYASLGQPAWHEREKVVVRRTGDRLVAAVDSTGRYVSNNFFVVFRHVGRAGESEPGNAGHALDLHGLCALLNSDVLTWYFRTIEPRVGRAFAELKIKHLAAFPLPARDDYATCRRLNVVGRACARDGGASCADGRGVLLAGRIVRRAFQLPGRLPVE